MTDLLDGTLPVEDGFLTEMKRMPEEVTRNKGNIPGLTEKIRLSTCNLIDLVYKMDSTAS